MTIPGWVKTLVVVIGVLVAYDWIVQPLTSKYLPKVV